jgi:hypothetical protein
MPMSRAMVAFAHFVVCAAVAFSGIASAVAEPLQLRFTATVTGEVEGDASRFQLPFALAPGQLIHGSLKFDSIDAALELLTKEALVYPSSLSRLSLETDGRRLGSRINGGAINLQLIYLNRPQPPPSSSLSFGYGNSWTDAFPGWGGGQVGPRHYHFNAGLRLEGPVGTIPDPEQARDIAVWNQLSTRRQLSLTFGHLENNEFHVVDYFASIGEIMMVPEPSGGLLLLCAAATLVLRPGICARHTGRIRR